MKKQQLNSIIKEIVTECILEKLITESVAPGQEDWVLANKKKFIDQYGKKKGMEILYATAWKRSKKKSEPVSEAGEKIPLGKLAQLNPKIANSTDKSKMKLPPPKKSDKKGS